MEISYKSDVWPIGKSRVWRQHGFIKSTRIAFAYQCYKKVHTFGLIVVLKASIIHFPKLFFLKESELTLQPWTPPY